MEEHLSKIKFLIEKDKVICLLSSRKDGTCGDRRDWIGFKPKICKYYDICYKIIHENESSKNLTCPICGEELETYLNMWKFKIKKEFGAEFSFPCCYCYPISDIPTNGIQSIYLILSIRKIISDKDLKNQPSIIDGFIRSIVFPF